MSKGYVYILLNETYDGLLKIGKSTKHPDLRAKELSGTGMIHPFMVAYYEEVSDCDLAEKLVHEELKEFRPKLNREFFKVSSTEAVKVVQRIAEKVNREKPFPEAIRLEDDEPPSPPSPPSPPARLYAISFNCEGCGKYQSTTVERYATKTKCPWCQFENNTNVTWI